MVVEVGDDRDGDAGDAGMDGNGKTGAVGAVRGGAAARRNMTTINNPSWISKGMLSGSTAHTVSAIKLGVDTSRPFINHS